MGKMRWGLGARQSPSTFLSQTLDYMTLALCEIGVVIPISQLRAVLDWVAREETH